MLIGCLCAVLGRQPRAARVIGYGSSLFGGLAILICAVWILVGGLGGSVTLFYPTPFLSFGMRVDSIAAAFALTIGIATTVVSLAAIGLARVFDANGGTRLVSLFNLFVGTMLLVVLADSVFSFLIVWELMSLLGYLLIAHHHERVEVRHAAFQYLMMAHIATVFIAAGMMTISTQAGGAFMFETLASTARGIAEPIRSVLFVAFVIGFATKAGLAPFHIWMPRAESLAPAHIGAIMSGATINVALYGLVRMVFDVLGPSPQWWGWLLIALGTLSAIVGVVYAVLERDLLRLLAFSSVENVGIIVVGFGAALVLRSNELGAAAGLALVAALVHMNNHAIFKSALFLGMGAVEHATGTRDIERLGGLARQMPIIGGCILIGSLAAAALPPFNGFVGEWLLFQSLLSVGRIGGIGFSAAAATAAAAVLALAGGLAVAAFVKAYGLTFLGRPRAIQHEAVADVSIWVRASLVLAAVACMVLGLLPGSLILLLRPIGRIVGAELTTKYAISGGAVAFGAPIRADQLTLLIPISWVGFAFILGGSAWLLFRLLGTVPRRIGPVWVCGFDLDAPMQYSAAGFVEPVRLFLRGVLKPSRASIASGGLLPYFPARLRLHSAILALAEHYVYSPLFHALRDVARRVSVIQNGDLRAYLAYVFVILIVLLWALQ